MSSKQEERLNKACIVVKTLARTNFEINDITENTKIEDIKLLLFNKYCKRSTMLYYRTHHNSCKTTV